MKKLNNPWSREYAEDGELFSRVTLEYMERLKLKKLRKKKLKKLFKDENTK